MANVCDFLPVNKTVVQVSTDGTTWTEVGGLNEITRSMDTETADVTTFDTAGRKREVPVSLADNFELTGLKKRGDMGQKMVEDAARLLGCDATIQARIAYLDAGDVDGAGFFDEIWVAEVSVQLDDVGGGVNDMISWGATLQLFDDPTITTGTNLV